MANNQNGNHNYKNNDSKINVHLIQNDGGTMLNSQMNEEWKWTGCSPNIISAIEITKLFLDSAEHEIISPYSIVNLHNNNVGRKVIHL